MTFNFWGLRKTANGYVPFVTVGLDFKNELVWYRSLRELNQPRSDH